MNENLSEALDGLICELKKTEFFDNYYRCIREIEGDSEAEARVNELRALSIKVQEFSEDEINREIENIEKRLEELCSDNRVAEFMIAESEFSRLYQEIVARIINSLEDDE